MPSGFGGCFLLPWFRVQDLRSLGIGLTSSFRGSGLPGLRHSGLGAEVLAAFNLYNFGIFLSLEPLNPPNPETLKHQHPKNPKTLNHHTAKTLKKPQEDPELLAGVLLLLPWTLQPSFKLGSPIGLHPCIIPLTHRDRVRVPCKARNNRRHTIGRCSEFVRMLGICH